MTPVEAFAEVGDLLVQVVKRPYRDEPMSAIIRRAINSYLSATAIVTESKGVSA